MTLLEQYRTAQVLDHADVQIARALQRLGGDADEAVGLAIGLCVLALREGSICLELDLGAERWIEENDPGLSVEVKRLRQALPRPPSDLRDRLAGSPLVADGIDAPQDRPLRLVASRLYLLRYWQDEQVIAREVESRTETLPVDPVAVRGAADRAAKLYGLSAEQREAVDTAVGQRLTLLAGGPGTGKTTTVAAILSAIRAVAGDVRVAVAAPTGKAATRLQEAINDSVEKAHDASMPAGEDAATASTIHRLLRRRPGSNETFRYNRGNRLPYDVVVVDEMSMVSLPLMARLLEAAPPEARLVLVGDPHQLASVEAGAVFSDLVEWRRGSGGLAELTKNFRNAAEIADFSAAVLAQNKTVALEVLRVSGGNVEFLPYDPSDPSEAAQELCEAAVARVKAFAAGQSRSMTAAAVAGDASLALNTLNEFRILCGHRFGPYGVADWHRRVDQWTGSREAADPSYIGRPVLVTENDYTVGVFNGETGVVVQHDGQRKVAIDQPGAELRLFAPVNLPSLNTVHAMTVHKSQGSQFDVVAVVLPPVGSPLLTGELLYTAVTRAKSRVLLLGTEAAVAEAIRAPARRASGLGD